MCCCFCCCRLWSMGLTPLFELFTGPLSFHLANYVQRFGWGNSSEKSNPRLPRQTGVNRTLHTVFKVVQYLRWHNICVTLYYCIQRSGSTEPPSLRYLFWFEFRPTDHNIPRSDAGEALSFIQYLMCIGVSIYNRPTSHLKVYFKLHVGSHTSAVRPVSITVLYMSYKIKIQSQSPCCPTYD